MQALEFLGHEDLIFFLICHCLVSILAWTVFLSLLNVPWRSSSHEATKSRSRESTEDRSDSRKLPMDYHPGGNQFLAKTLVVNECNYADFVPVSESQSSLHVSSSVTIDDYNLLEEILKDVPEYFLTNSKNHFEDLQEICDASGTRRGTKIERRIEDETLMGSLLNRDSNNSIKARKSVENTHEQFEHDVFVNETNSLKRLIRRKTSTENVTIEENFAKFESRDGNQSGEKFRNDQVVSKTIWNDSCVERKNRVDASSNDKVCSQNKFVARLEIGRSNSNEESEIHSVDTKMKAEERPETVSSNSVVEKSPVSVFQESNKSEAKWNGSSNDETIPSKACGTEISAQPREYESTEKEKEDNREATLLDDEDHSKMVLDRFEEGLNSPQKDTEICSRKGGDYLGEQFGIFPEKEANCTEEKSIIHSGKNETSFHEEEKEEEEVFGRLPDANLPKSDHDAESTISVVRPVAENYGKEEENLNAIVQRMIITELRKHRRKEQTNLKKAHSDTESMIPNKKNNVRNRTGLLNFRGRTFFRDLLELGESLRKNFEDKSDNESTEMKFDDGTVNRKHPMTEAPNCLKDSVDSCTMVVHHSHGTDNLTNSMEVTCTVVSNILLERKVNLPCMTAVEAEELIKAGRSSVTCRQKYTTKSTQTEHVYVIHTARSCPLGKRRLPLQLQLQRLLSTREAVSSKTVYASRDFSKFIFRKASDNLIYEKGKGSLSPSYIPAPERFRWRYLTPNKVTCKDWVNATEAKLNRVFDSTVLL